MEKLLMKRWVELNYLIPDYNKWYEDQLKDNPPRLYRLQMINALMKALDIDVTHSMFARGRFINDNEIDSSVIEKMINTYNPIVIKESGYKSYEDKLLLNFMFSALWRYKQNYYNMLDCNGGVLAASGLGHLALRLTSVITNNTAYHFKIIDELLSKFKDKFTRPKAQVGLHCGRYSHRRRCPKWRLCC